MNWGRIYKACQAKFSFILPRKQRFFARMAKKIKILLGFLGKKNFQNVGKDFNIIQEIQDLGNKRQISEEIQEAEHWVSTRDEEPVGIQKEGVWRAKSSKAAIKYVFL